jgi:hypothetical protein
MTAFAGSEELAINILIAHRALAELCYSDVDNAGKTAVRCNLTKFSKKVEGGERAPLLKYSSDKNLMKAARSIWPYCLDSLGISGEFTDYNGKKFDLERMFYFQNNSPTRFYLAVFSDLDRMEDAISIAQRIPEQIMLLENLTTPAKVECTGVKKMIAITGRIGDYEDEKVTSPAALTEGKIFYSPRKVPILEVIRDLVISAEYSDRFIPKAYYLGVDQNRSIG